MKCRKNRGDKSRIASAQKQDTSRGGDLTTDRRPPEDDQQVFSLYESVDAEPHAPPMELSRSVLALLESFDVDPVRGEACLPAAVASTVDLSACTVCGRK